MLISSGFGMAPFVTFLRRVFLYAKTVKMLIIVYFLYMHYPDYQNISINSQGQKILPEGKQSCIEVIIKLKVNHKHVYG